MREVQQSKVGHTRSVWFTSLSIDGIFTASFRISWKVGPTIASYIHVAPCIMHLFLSIVSALNTTCLQCHQSCVHQNCLALAVTGAQLGLVFCEGQGTCDNPTLVWGNTNQISTATRTSPYRGILQVQTTSRALHTMCSKIRIACDAAEDASRGGLTYHCNIGQANFSKPWSREYSSQYTNHYMHRRS